MMLAGGPTGFQPYKKPTYFLPKVNIFIYIQYLSCTYLYLLLNHCVQYCTCFYRLYY
jgi:hypothetical protein